MTLSFSLEKHIQGVHNDTTIKLRMIKIKWQDIQFPPCHIFLHTGIGMHIRYNYSTIEQFCFSFPVLTELECL